MNFHALNSSENMLLAEQLWNSVRAEVDAKTLSVG